MNHSPPFQRLWAQLRTEVYALQSKGYFGDGYYSSGTRLRDSAPVRGQGIGGVGEILPEYVCGGAHSQKRSGYMKSHRKRRPKSRVVPSNHTGAQTERRVKAGTRLTKALPGEGVKISEEGGSKGKRANSKRARDERAQAAERRMLALQGKPSTPPGPLVSDDEDDGTEDNDGFEPEDDELRRQAMSGVMDQDEMDLLRLSRPPDPAEPGPSAASSSSSSTRNNFSEPPKGAQGKRKGLIEGMVQQEITKRRRESLGMDGPGKKLGGSKDAAKSRETSTNSTTRVILGSSEANSTADWTCGVCTLENHADYARCAVCGEPRGSTSAIF